MALYFNKKHIRRQMMNKNGEILRVFCFFHMEKAILVVWQSAIVEQKLLKW